ncbi:MAG: UDP-N-acetylglucosamine 2-epimerase (hydrolyzing) [Candidatus Omnitrophica bacterium]|nr:UDP-N-acetylglucosamine 2-epimerase (hydrolyzing) [Candidatus Omnitrophota bacterium]
MVRYYRREKRKTAIFTGNRAEYGLLYPIIKAISNHPKLDYFLLVSGAHLDEKFGYTKEEIEKDGFKVYKEVKVEAKTDTLCSTTQTIGHTIINVSKILDKLKPDFLVVYGDRFEVLGAVIAGSQMSIPIAHIEGGDVTRGGALDDYVRHAITKLSHLHFTTNKEAASRIAKLGEEKWRIFNVGFPVIDLIKEGKFADSQEIENRFGIHSEKPLIVFTQHSVTTELSEVESQMKPALEALEYFAEKDTQVILTYPNNDAGGRRIIHELKKMQKKKIPNMFFCPHAGRYYYHGLLNICGKTGKGVCVGNSSSGIKETPAFGCPFVNIGTRQKGRLRSTNVIDAHYNKKHIIVAVNKALFDKRFRARCKQCKNPYGEGESGKKIANILATIKIDKDLIQKKITY